MFDWISCRGHYAVHIKTVLRLAEVLLNREIFNKRSQLCLVLKKEYRGNYAVHIKTVLRLTEVLLKPVNFQ